MHKLWFLILTKRNEKIEEAKSERVRRTTYVAANRVVTGDEDIRSLSAVKTEEDDFGL